jgi:hypothetical protein
LLDLVVVVDTLPYNNGEVVEQHTFVAVVDTLHIAVVVDSYMVGVVDIHTVVADIHHMVVEVVDSIAVVAVVGIQEAAAPDTVVVADEVVVFHMIGPIELLLQRFL